MNRPALFTEADLRRAPDWPRGLNREQAAAYIGVGTSLFDAMVKDGRMPKPKEINSRTVWDRHRLDVAFEELPDRGACNPWDEAVRA